MIKKGIIIMIVMTEMDFCVLILFSLKKNSIALFPSIVTVVGNGVASLPQL